MYAIVESGGKQYRVELGSEIAVERLAGEPGAEVVLERVLLVADEASATIGRPHVAGAQVRASVVRQDRGDKVVVFKYRPKARHRVKRGHRQELTVLRVADIVLDGRSAAEAAAKVAEETEAEREQASRAAAEQAARDAALAAELARKAAAARAEEAAQAEAAAPEKKKAPGGARRRAKAQEPTEPGAKAEPREPAAKAEPTKPPAKAERKAAQPAVEARSRATRPRRATGTSAKDADKTDNGRRRAGRAQKES